MDHGNSEVCQDGLKHIDCTLIGAIKCSMHQEFRDLWACHLGYLPQEEVAFFEFVW